MYTFRLLNSTERNYTIIKRGTLTTVYVLHKFRHYLLGNRFVFYVDHIALIYLINKLQVFGILIKWFILFLEYDFKILYKLALQQNVGAIH